MTADAQDDAELIARVREAILGGAGCPAEIDADLLREAARRNCRPAIASRSPVTSPDTVEPSLCSHAGSCEQNLVEHDGAFCANLPKPSHQQPIR
jgi:hypothetical protein